jgi:hypothetical protein
MYKHIKISFLLDSADLNETHENPGREWPKKLCANSLCCVSRRTPTQRMLVMRGLTNALTRLSSHHRVISNLPKISTSLSRPSSTSPFLSSPALASTFCTTNALQSFSGSNSGSGNAGCVPLWFSIFFNCTDDILELF